jgi:hypothetical protein
MRRGRQLSNGLLGGLFAVGILGMPFVFEASVTRGAAEAFSARFTVSELAFVLLAAILCVRWRRPRLSPVLIPVSIAVAAFLVSGLAHPSSRSILKTLQFAAAFGCGFAAVREYLRSESGPDRLLRWMAVATAACVALALGQVAAGRHPFFVSGGLFNNHTYGMFLLACFPFLLAQVGGTLRRTKISTLTVLCALAVLVSATLADTGLVVALAIETAAFLWLLFRDGRRWIAPCLTVAAMLVLHGFTHSRDLREFVSKLEPVDVATSFARSSRLAGANPRVLLSVPVRGRSLRLAAPLLGVDVLPIPEPSRQRDEAIPNQRFAEWIAGWRMMAARPFAGVGFGNYQMHIGEYFAPMPKFETREPDSQNGWIVLGSSVGVVGAAALFWALVLAASAGLRSQRERERGEDSLASRNGRMAAAVFAGSVGVLVGGLWTPFTQSGALVPLAVLLAAADSLPGGGPHEPHSLRKRMWRLCVALGLIAAIFPAFSLLRGMKTNETGDVCLWREAETADEVVPPMRIAADREASGGEMAEIPKGVGRGWLSEAGGSAAYDIEIPVAGTYRLWARTRWGDGCGNTFFVRFGDGPRLVLGNDAVFGEWHWVALGGVSLHAGRVRVEVSNREDGVALDKFALTNDSDFHPVGKWDLAFSRDLGRTPLRGWETPAPQQWQPTGAGKGQRLSLPHGDYSGTARMLLTAPLDSDFEITFTCRLLDTDSDIRLVPLFESDDDFLFLELQPGHTSLCRMRAGEAEVLESVKNAPAIVAGVPLRVAFAFRNGSMTAACNGAWLLEHVDRRLAKGRCGFDSTAGGAEAIAFDVRPLDDIYYLYEKAKATHPSARQGETLIGNDSWANYSIALKFENGSLGRPLRFRADSGGQNFCELLPHPSGYTLRVVRNGQEIASQPISLSPTSPAAPHEFVLRLIEREVTLLVGGREVATALLPPEAPLRGAIGLSLEGVDRVEVKGLRRFFDGFGGCDGNNSASWSPVSGKWRVFSEEVEGLQDTFGQFASGAALTLAGEPSWENYSLSCMTRASGDGTVGLVFHYRDAGNYDLVRWVGADSAISGAGRIELVRRRNGTDQVVALAPLAREANRWYELRVVPNALGGDGTLILQVDATEVLSAPPDDSPAVGQIGLFVEDCPGSFFDNVKVDFY